jgi:hypothetical protein
MIHCLLTWTLLILSSEAVEGRFLASVVPARLAVPEGPAVPGGAAVPGSCGTLAPFPP